jgi:hypothetical protein
MTSPTYVDKAFRPYPRCRCRDASFQSEPGRLVVQTDSRSRFQVFVIVEGDRPVVDDSGYA